MLVEVQVDEAPPPAYLILLSFRPNNARERELVVVPLVVCVPAALY